jgi:hypothetical protein
MSINKNLKFSDYKEVILLPDVLGAGDRDYIFLSDNDAARTTKQKIISSLFLKAKFKTSQDDASFFFILKPECLWLKLTSGAIVDCYGTSEDKMIKYAPYKQSEILKASFLKSKYTIQDLTTQQGVALPELFQLSDVFMYDLNELNRSRVSGSGNGSSSSTISRWL